jgi:hypothetical protein
MKFTYRVNGEEVSLTVSEEFVAIRFKEPAPYSDRLAGVSRPEFCSFDERFEIPKEKFTVFPVARSPVSAKAPSEQGP